MFDDLDDVPEPRVLPRPRPQPKGSEERYKARLETFRSDGRPYPRLRHEAIWLLHNVVVHPMLAVGPTRVAVELHELTSQWLNATGLAKSRMGDDVTHRVLSTEIPRVPRRPFWVLHNVAAHMLIGLFPTRLTFRLHDWTAALMDVPGWV